MYSLDHSITIKDIVRHFKGITKNRVKPNLFIVGFPKCGTSSLHYILNQHPDIQMSERKEINFFTQNMRKGLNWYKSFWKNAKRKKYFGESSIFYSIYPSIPELIKCYYPKSTIIFIIRNPVDRFISHYVNLQRNYHIKHKISLKEISEIKLTLMDYVNFPKIRFAYLLEYNKYEQHIKRFKDCGFKVIVLKYEDLFSTKTELNYEMEYVTRNLNLRTWIFENIHVNKTPDTLYTTIKDNFPEWMKELIIEQSLKDKYGKQYYR